MNIRTFVAILSRNLQYDFPKMRGGGGQRPFGTFLKIHPFWRRRLSLRLVKEGVLTLPHCLPRMAGLTVFLVLLPGNLGWSIGGPHFPHLLPPSAPRPRYYNCNNVTAMLSHCDIGLGENLKVGPDMQRVPQLIILFEYQNI